MQENVRVVILFMLLIWQLVGIALDHNLSSVIY